MPQLHPLKQLAEHVRDWRTADLTVDGPNRLVRNVALTGRDSANGYRYSEAALKRAIPLYENKPVFLDHARNTARPFERSTRDLVGSVVNPRFEDGRIRADVQTLDTEAGRTFLALAESQSPAVGMSHVVLARRSADNAVVETIEQVVSVDAVAFPATQSTFREQHQPQDDDEISEPLPGSLEAVLETIDAALPRHVSQLDGRAVDRVRRIGLFPEHVLVEADRDDLPAVRCRIGWSLRNGDLVLGEASEPVADADSSLTDWQPGRSPLEARVAELTAERDDLQEQLDRREAERRCSERERRTRELLRESPLPEAAVTEQWLQRLLELDDESAQRAAIAERMQLIKQLRVHRPASSERRDANRPEADDAAFVAAVQGPRRFRAGGT